MALTERDLSDILAERQDTSERVLDRYGALRESYDDWKQRVAMVDRIYAGDWSVVWPDRFRTDGLPKIPNLVQIAAEDRARIVAAGNPSIICRPEGLTERAKRAAEKRERILAGYWERNRVRAMIPRFAHDLMAAGLAVVKVMPDFTEPKNERFPLYTRIDPRYAYPSPAFAEGPYVDDMVVSYEEKLRVVRQRFGEETYKDVAGMIAKTQQARSDVVRVIEFYDHNQVAVMCQTVGKQGSLGRAKGAWTWLVEPTKHNLDRCPVVIGVRPTMDGVYRGDFDSTLAVLNVWNKFMNLELDAAIDTVYPERLVYDIADDSEFGPDSTIEKVSPQGSVEYVKRPGTGFSTFQMMGLLGQFARAGAILPVARSGDPNESIISAAGISAVNSQMADHVRSLQRDSLAPMFQAANEVAFCSDEKWADAEKQIFGYYKGQAFSETYSPSKDIDGNYRNAVTYGMGAGLDEVNTNVLVLQQVGSGLISRKTGREQSPFVENPQDEEKAIAMEQLDQATLAGLIAKAQTGELDAVTLAAIRKDLESGAKTLHDAILENVVQAPLAPPPGMQGQPGSAGSPGIPGAAEGGAQPRPLPPLQQLLG